MKKIKQVIAYIKHVLKAHNKNGFGIHSPYIFHLVTEIIHDFTPFYCFSKIERERKILLTNNNVITVTDFGVGSPKLRYPKKKIRDIAKYSLKTPKQAQLLFRLVNHLGSMRILEIGTSLGITTSYLASVSGKSQVTTLEGCPELSNIANGVFQKLGLKNICQITGNFKDTLPHALKKIGELDFVFFDGNHKKAATLMYFEACLKHTCNNTVFVFDDIHMNDEMEQAWIIIKKNNMVKVTLDLFYLGIVFFRKEFACQDFRIRL